MNVITTACADAAPCRPGPLTRRRSADPLAPRASRLRPFSPFKAHSCNACDSWAPSSLLSNYIKLYQTIEIMNAGPKGKIGRLPKGRQEQVNRRRRQGAYDGTGGEKGVATGGGERGRNGTAQRTIPTIGRSLRDGGMQVGIWLENSGGEGNFEVVATGCRHPDGRSGPLPVATLRRLTR